MAEFFKKLKKLKWKLSWKYLLFILFIIIGCSYQVIQIVKVYLEFETKIDVKYDDQSEIAILPKLSLCKETTFLMRNYSLRDYKKILGLSPAQLYNMTFSFKEIVIGFISPPAKQFEDEEHRIKAIIHYEKTISLLRTCYHFKYPNENRITGKNTLVYNLNLYNHEIHYDLYLSSNIDYKLNRAKSLEIFGN